MISDGCARPWISRGVPGVMRERSEFVQWEMDCNRISERGGRHIEDKIRDLREAFSDEHLLTADLEGLVSDYVAGLPPHRLEIIGRSRCESKYRRAVRDFRHFCAEAGIV